MSISFPNYDLIVLLYTIYWLWQKGGEEIRYTIQGEITIWEEIWCTKEEKKYEEKYIKKAYYICINLRRRILIFQKFSNGKIYTESVGKCRVSLHTMPTLGMLY